MKINFILLLLLLISCAKEKPSYIKPGLTPISIVLEKEGKPIEVKDSHFDKNREIYYYKNFDLQVNKQKVEAVFRKPEAFENSLQYWRQKYKNEKTSFKKVESIGHEEVWQFQIKDQGLSIIYNKSINQVTRISRHE